MKIVQGDRVEGGRGSEHRGGRDIYSMIAGTGTLESEPYRTQTTLFLDRGEQATFMTREKNRLLHFHLHLPNLNLLNRRLMPDRASRAAE
ncbi:MAG: hypothetical protein WD407_10665 [Rhodospirillales bacterium]